MTQDLPSRAKSPDCYAFGPFRLLVDRRELSAHGVPVVIGQRAIEVLVALVQRHGELVTKDALMAAVWPGVVVEENNLAVHVSVLRKVLGKTDDDKPYLQTVAGRGYRFVADVTHESLPALEKTGTAVDAPASAARARSDNPHNLPSPLTRLIGRAEELEAIKARLKSSRLVTLTGTGGVGKTRLAIEIGTQLLADCEDGPWIAELAPINDAQFVLSVVSDVLGVTHAVEASVDRLAAALKTRQLLVILDNCEHVIAEVAALAQALIQKCPRISILATSREPLAIAGESVFRVPSLSSPAPTAELTAEAAWNHPAVQLFVERATALGEDFSLTDDNVAAIAAICRRIDGIPLAIELAAPRLRVMSEQQLVDGLDERFSLLTGGSRTAVPRHQTLHALIDWSYSLLGGEEQRMLRCCSVFAGSAAQSSIAAVAAGAGVPELRILDLLASLVDKSLLIAERHQGETRYRLLESTRYFARDRLAAAGELDWHRLHADHFVERFMQATAAWETSAAEPWLTRFGADIDNLRAALDWAFGAGGRRAIGVELLGYSHVMWSELGLMPEHRHWTERALAAVEADTPAAVLARVLSWQAGEVRDVDDPTDVDDALRAAALYDALGDRFGQGKMLMRAGTVCLSLDDRDDGEDLLRRAQSLLAPFGNTKTLARCLSALASARLFAADMTGARALHQEAIAITRGLPASPPLRRSHDTVTQ
jgi:predicted ATPase/DNA-binding winged helix-turn-helix (wHTH) protein